MKVDFNNLGFEYTKTNCSYISYYKDGKQDEGKLVEEDTISISLTSTALHYGQQGFEGMKAYRWKDESIHMFRIDENAKRLQTTCRKLLMPEVSTEKFIDAVRKVVAANQEFVWILFIFSLNIFLINFYIIYIKKKNYISDFLYSFFKLVLV